MNAKGKRRPKHPCVLALALALAGAVWLLPGVTVWARSTIDADLPTRLEELKSKSLDELMAMTVTLTTSSLVEERLAETTSNVFVITGEEMRLMGARSIHDALLYVPGISLGQTLRGSSRIGLRGVQTERSEKVLVLLNGHLITEARSGSATFQFLEYIPVSNIQQIEIVRGPGSALYGANAFLGVINVVTKRPDDIDGALVTISHEFENGGDVGRHGNVLVGKRLSDDVAFSLSIAGIDRNGPDLFVPEDRYGNPGTADAWKEQVDVHAMLEAGPLTLRGRYLERSAGDMYGFYSVLANDSNLRWKTGFLDAALAFEPFPRTELILRTYLDHHRPDQFFEALDPGSIPAASPFYPWNTSGLYFRSVSHETIVGSDVRFVCRKSDKHTLSLGLAGRNERLDHITTHSNYLGGVWLASIEDTSDPANWIKTCDRDIWAFYAEDIWQPSHGLRITLGVRAEHYSDFGWTVNPRLGALWQPTDKLDIRLGYATAFRAPDFFSQYVQPTVQYAPNPDLDPETIETIDLSIGMQVSSELRLAVTGYHSEMRDLVGTTAGDPQYRNLTNASVDGIEVEARWQPEARQWVAVTYACAETETDDGHSLPDGPGHRFTVRANRAFGKRWNCHVSGEWQSDSPRQSGDPRSANRAFIVVNTSVVYRTRLQGFDLQFSVFNLLDEEYAYASPANALPGDYPAPGRSFVLTGRYRF